MELFNSSNMDYVVKDLYSSRRWRERVIDSGFIPLHSGCKNLVFSLNTDGFNPYNNKASYSLWPIMLIVSMLMH